MSITLVPSPSTNNTQGCDSDMVSSTMRATKRNAAPHSDDTEKTKRQRKPVSKNAGVNDEEEEELSTYEKQRLDNLKRNQQLLEDLGVSADTKRLKEAKEANRPVRTMTKRQKTPTGPAEPLRRSTRGLDENGNKKEPVKVSTSDPIDPWPRIVGPVDIRQTSSCLTAMRDQRSVDVFAASVAELPTMPPKRVHISSASVLNNTLKRLTIGSSSLPSCASRVKVVKERIFTLDFHPGPQPFLAVGDKLGQVGLLDLRAAAGAGDAEDEDNLRVWTFAPHSRPVSGLQHDGLGRCLWSCSYDGTVRGLELETGRFELKFEEDDMLHHLAFPAASSLLLAAGGNGDLYRMDVRQSPAAASALDLHDRKIASVHAHPSDANLVVTASNDQRVCVWDLRKAVKSKPWAVLQHSLAVTSAYFSPQSGRTIVTTCNDNKLRFWDPSSDAVVESKHNNNTGRFITNFRAVWDPKTEDRVWVGNMDKKMDLFAADGELVASLEHESCTAIPAVIAAHPSATLVASGNGSGYVNIWSPKDS